MLIDPGGPYDGQLVTIIRDGVNCWMYLPMGAYPVKKASDEAEATNLLPFNIQIYPRDQQKEYVLLGEEVIDGVNTKIVRIVDPLNPERITTVWIDSQRRVPMKVEKRYPPRKKDEEPVVLAIFYRDIRKLADGRHIPFKMEFYENGRLTKVVIYKAVNINIGVKDSLFYPMDKILK